MTDVASRPFEKGKPALPSCTVTCPAATGSFTKEDSGMWVLAALVWLVNRRRRLFLLVLALHSSATTR
ncbi:MAG: hypothetical protein ACR2MA_02620 [Egibacteraceae bacterium]